MSNQQLCLAIGLPILFNGVMLMIMLTYINTRFNGVDRRFDDMRDLWRFELRRVEEIIDARLKHLEERR
jgi:hypothetical protein